MSGRTPALNISRRKERKANAAVLSAICLAILGNTTGCEKAPGQSVLTPCSATHNCVFDTPSVREKPQLLWQRRVEGLASRTCVVRNDTVFFGSYKLTEKTGGFCAADAHDGHMIWQTYCGSMVHFGPLLHGETAFYGIKSDALVAVDAGTGKIRWRFPTAGKCCQPPALVGDALLFGTHGKRFYSVDARSGTLRKGITVRDGICCSPSFAGSHVYYTEWNGMVHALDAGTLEDSWSYQAPHRTEEPPTVDGDKCYVVAGKLVIALKVASGDVLWQSEVNDAICTAPGAKDGIVVVRTETGQSCGLSAEDGRILWRTEPTGLSYSYPAICGDLVYIGAADSLLYAHDLNTGRKMWTFYMGAPVNSPGIYDGVLYVTAGDCLYALR